MLGAKRNKTMPDVTFHTAYLSSLSSKQIHRALLESGHTELAEMLYESAQRSETDRRYAGALELFEKGVFEVDDAPVVSASEDGAFVMVWQWVDAESAQD